MDPRIKAGIFAGESKGDYNALFGFSNRPGGRWADTRLTDMSVNQAIDFAHPRGAYAQWVKSQIGRVATPMGGFQVVGNTLKQAKDWAGLTGDEQMTPEIQDRIGDAILKHQGTGAWAGYKGPKTPSVSDVDMGKLTSRTPMADQKSGVVALTSDADTDPAMLKDWKPDRVTGTTRSGDRNNDKKSVSQVFQGSFDDMEKEKQKVAWAWVQEAMRPRMPGPSFNIWGQ